MENTLSIPNEFYKYAATICDKLPDISFPDIARVLYEREKYLAENMPVVAATTGEPVDNLFDVSGATEYAKLGIDDEPKAAETMKPERRRSRSQWKRIRLNDGREFTSTNGILGLFKQLGIKDEYAGFFDGNKERDLRKEAEKLSRVIEKRLCLVVTEYYTYNFDGVLENFILQEKI